MRYGIPVIFSLAWLGLSVAAHAGIDAWVEDPFATGDEVGSAPARLWDHHPQLPALPAAASLPAQEQGQTWSLAQLSNYALEHNPQTAAAWAGLKAQAAALGMTESAWLPTLSLNTGFTRREAASTAGFTVPTRNIANPNLSLSYTLWDFGLRAAKVDAARAQTWVAGYTQNQNIQQVAFLVAQSYYQLLGNEALLEADRKTLAESRNNLDAAEQLHRAGQATIGALYQARASLAQAQSSLAAQEQTVAASRGALANACGLAPDTILRIVPLDDTRAPPTLGRAAEDLMQAALRANPALQEARAQVAAAQANLRSAPASGLPSLGVNSNYGYLFQGGFRPATTWAIGFTLTVPIFNGYNTHYQIRQARAQEEQARADLANSRNTAMLAVWQDYHSFRGALAAYPGARSGLENARKALEVVQAQYKVGQATIQDVLQAEATLAQARNTLIQNLVTSYVALAQLTQAVGMPLGAAKP